MTLRPRRRIGAYGVCRDGHGRVLLVRASQRSVRPGTWFLPGGGVEHGEHPAQAVVRELAEETGLAGTVVRPRAAAAELVPRPPYLDHTDGVLYDLEITAGDLRPEQGGTSDAVRWVGAGELAGLALSGFAARVLGLPVPDEPVAAVATAPRRGTVRRQRFAAYGQVTDPAGRVLLTLNADGYPGAGRWHAPGGGTDFGEQPTDGLLREVFEESGQRGSVGELLAVTHHHNPMAPGPDGDPIDAHSVHALYRVTVPEPTEPQVHEVGGSTAAAAWLTPREAAALPLTVPAAAVLRDLM